MSPTPASAHAPREIWLDADPGFDDWFAWALLEGDPQVHLHGVSVVAGNAPLPVVLSNARRIQALHGWRTPLWAGADRPLVQPQVTAQDVLGAQGLQTIGAVLPAPESPLQPGHGVDAMIDAVRARPGRITLLAIGPLTNVALAFAKAPDLPERLGGLVVMGGSQGAGNTTPVAEFNIYADPEAAAQVFALAHRVPGGVRLFGIEVCRQVQGTEAHVAAVRAKPLGGPTAMAAGADAGRGPASDPASGSAAGAGLGTAPGSVPGRDAAAVFADHFGGYVDGALRRGRPSAPMYDATPVAWLAHPEWFTLQPAFVDVELHGRLTRGMTVCELRVPQRARPNAEVAVAAEGAKVMDWAVNLLRGTL